MSQFSTQPDKKIMKRASYFPPEMRGIVFSFYSQREKIKFSFKDIDKQSAQIKKRQNEVRAKMDMMEKGIIVPDMAKLNEIRSEADDIEKDVDMVTFDMECSKKEVDKFDKLHNLVNDMFDVISAEIDKRKFTNQKELDVCLQETWEEVRKRFPNMLEVMKEMGVEG
jgi:hypothetical protein